MDRLIWLDSTWQYLIRDVELTHGFQSPMLSWLGAAAIVAILTWHVCTLTLAGIRIRLAYHRVCPLLARLVQERQAASKEWIVLPSLTKKHPSGLQGQGRRDLDDLQTLDRALRTEPAFAGEWLSYRKSFSIEQPSWFIEPTVHTKRSAAEFFSLEDICAGAMNLRLYQQLPSLITGIGLAFTFLAILIGLSKLHADGVHIEGMQGLINGLAGKFVTSIVGLACANLFLVLEKSLLFRLSRYHRQFLSMLDDMFPQRVLDHGAQAAAAPLVPKVSSASPPKTDSLGRLAESLSQRMGDAVNALSTISESLTASGAKAPSPDHTELARALTSALKQELAPLLTPLHEAVRDLARSIVTARANEQLSPSDLEGLVATLKHRSQDTLPTDAQPLRQTAGRFSWMFPQSGSKPHPGALVE